MQRGWSQDQVWHKTFRYKHTFYQLFDHCAWLGSVSPNKSWPCGQNWPFLDMSDHLYSKYPLATRNGWIVWEPFCMPIAIGLLLLYLFSSLLWKNLFLFVYLRNVFRVLLSNNTNAHPDQRDPLGKYCLWIIFSTVFFVRPTRQRLYYNMANLVTITMAPMSIHVIRLAMP